MVFTSKIFEKHLWKSDILSKDGGHRPAQVFFKHFATKNQLPDLSIDGTLEENALINSNKSPRKYSDFRVLTVNNILKYCQSKHPKNVLADLLISSVNIMTFRKDF